MTQTLKSVRENLAKKEIVSNIRDNARDVWLAGLGAFSAMQSEGGKALSVAQARAAEAFKTLVAQGMEVEARAVEATVEKAANVTEKTAQTIGKLEQVFQDRISRTLARLDVPSREDMKALTIRVEELSKNVQTLIEAKAPRARKAPRA